MSLPSKINNYLLLFFTDIENVNKNKIDKSTGR